MDSSAGEGVLLAGRYRLERVLGSGGMAAVWLGRDERLGRPVAVKLLSDTLAHDHAYVTRFRREAHLAAGLSHPNLVRVYDFGGENERPYLVMEWIDGDTLADRIGNGRVAELEPRRVTRELLGALDRIHSAAIVHRDIKPANVLIAGDHTVKVTDFGIAQAQDATRLTATGMVIGTLKYIAPEVLRGDPATVQSDLYACGMVLEEAFGSRLAPDLAGLARELRSEDPARRPGSASRALELLAPKAAPTEDATASTIPLSTERTAPTATAAGRSSRSNRARLLGGLALIAGVLVGGVALLGGGDEPPTRPSKTEATQTTEATTVTQTVQAEPTETVEPGSSSAKPKKVKPPKAPKFPPGKAKGLKKH